VCLAGLIGGPPVTTYGENTGVLALTKNYNPKILLIAACYSIFLGIISKFGGILASVPGPVIGGASMILFGMIASMGVKVLVDNRVNITETKNMIILAIILVMGLGFSAGGVNAHISDVSISALAIATLAGIILNLILPHKQTSIGAESESLSSGDPEAKDVKDEKNSGGDSADVQKEAVESQAGERDGFLVPPPAGEEGHKADAEGNPVSFGTAQP
jgi:xanthine/uracil permease